MNSATALAKSSLLETPSLRARPSADLNRGAGREMAVFMAEYDCGYTTTASTRQRLH